MWSLIHQLKLLYESLAGKDFTRVLVTHNPGPILKCRVSLAPGTCVLTISSSVAAVAVIHVLEANRDCIAIRLLPVFLWRNGDKPDTVVYVGGEPGFYSPQPELVYAKPRTNAEACSLFGNKYPAGLVRQFMDEDIFDAAGGPLDDGSVLRPMVGLDEIIASAELRRRPNRRFATERGEIPSDPAMLMRGTRPYSQHGFEDDFDEEMRAGYIPDYLRARRIVDGRPVPSTDVPTEDQPWVLHLGRPFSRTKLGYRASFLVMAEVWSEALRRPGAVDWGSVSVRLRSDGECLYFKPATAAWRSLVIFGDNSRKVETLPLVAVEARVVEGVSLEPEGAAAAPGTRPSLQHLWACLPEKVTVEMVQDRSWADAAAPPVILSSAEFEVNPLDFTGDFVGDPRDRIKGDVPDAWALVLVGKSNAFLDSIQAAFEVNGHPAADQPLEFFDPNLVVIRAKGTEDDTVVLRERAGILATSVAIISEGTPAETYRQEVEVADGFGTRTVVVAVGDEAFRQSLEDDLHRPVHRLERCGSGRFATQDRQALMLLQACREAAVRWVPTEECAEQHGWEIVEYADLRKQGTLRMT